MTNYQAWQVNPGDFPAGKPLTDQLQFIGRYGLLAPSVHNTQPWQFDINEDSITVRLEPSRQLGQGDPTGRETWLSLACCVQNLVVAGHAFGFMVQVNPSYEEWLIKLTFKPGNKANRSALAAIVKRTSDRGHYSSSPVDAAKLQQLAKCYNQPDILIKTTSDRQAIELLASLTGRAIGLALSLPAFKRELAELMRPNWTNKPDGLVGAALGLGSVRSAFEPWRFRYLPVAASEAGIEKNRLLHSGALALVFSRGDMPNFWLEAGRAYQQIAITASQLGLAQATTAAVVEAPDFHTEVEEFFGTDFRLQTIMRLGYSQQPAPHSPRRQLQDVVTST